MTDAQDTPGAPAPILLERGRYAISQMSDGSWAIVRATGICDACLAHGCGEQLEPIFVPAMIVPFITGQAELSPAGAMKLVKGMIGNGK